jgi:hypothetical protein
MPGGTAPRRPVTFEVRRYVTPLHTHGGSVASKLGSRTSVDPRLGGMRAGCCAVGTLAGDRRPWTPPELRGQGGRQAAQSDDLDPSGVDGFGPALVALEDVGEGCGGCGGDEVGLEVWMLQTHR